MRTVETALVQGVRSLAECSETPRLDAQLLMAQTLGRPRSWLVAHADSVVSARKLDRFMRLCERRACGIPIAYLTGRGSFYGRELAINGDVLVPRPETEQLIEVTLEFLRTSRKMNARILDVGTGSGAIAITIAAELPEAIVDATDISPDALRVARRNARRHGVQRRCTFYRGDLTRPVRGMRYDVIIANLPYVPTTSIPVAPSPLSFEPNVALDGGNDGLAVYRRLMDCAADVMCADAFLVMEGAPPTIERLKALAIVAFPGARVEAGKDLSLRDRYVCVHRQVRR
ncbi:MAG: peptide chain release factor N(5)-glutamine methyltransferase [Candidatus Eremiobacteraeota bacterium]|nr:peptide chain release factor N(5)-glutamine methyltransferase [Candidatus Eremiobacteraeota bacterium]